jgi:hypothetical protein
MKINADLSINRTSRDEVTISVTDDKSHTEFVKLSLTLEQFAFAITGMHVSDVEGIVRGLDVVGKTKITKRVSVECPLDTYDKKALEEWLKEHGKEDGWDVSSYLGSQSSVVRHEGKTVLNYTLFRYE